jgi:aryl-alcohol dehydrogenase-like predicted oxidoreductase
MDGVACSARLVETCLDSGITVFDTTYQGERLALGQALHAVGRRHEATIICTSARPTPGARPTATAQTTHRIPRHFLTDCLPVDITDQPRVITEATLDQWKTELQTDYLESVRNNPALVCD